jgi:hypothetical protein
MADSESRHPGESFNVEPHAAYLKVPPDDQVLYKVMKVENLIRSIEGSYLHFNRVDSYTDGPTADEHDGEQVPLDRAGNPVASFAKAPGFTLAHYYDQTRSRTYACCFSLEISDSLWKDYGSGSGHGSVCVAFNFGKLRATLNETLQAGATLQYEGKRCRQIFSVDYGLVDYVGWGQHRAADMRYPNPITYTYLKDRARFSGDRELRVALSAIGVGQFALADGSIVAFPKSLPMAFSFQKAIGDGTIQKICCGPECDLAFLESELHKAGIKPKATSGPIPTSATPASSGSPQAHHEGKAVK